MDGRCDDAYDFATTTEGTACIRNGARERKIGCKQAMRIDWEKLQKPDSKELRGDVEQVLHVCQSLGKYQLSLRLSTLPMPA